jgi:4,5-DOPA dioxygenase extradiol
MPVLFVGHGSPMNAIDDNEFSKGWQNIGKKVPTPKAILCISAHWETHGTFVTAMDKPKTIHDFGGFPEELYEIQYPAPGDSGLAKEIKSMLKKPAVGLDSTWGLDHGAWSVLRRMFPTALVPVVQLSLDRSLSAQGHYELAQELLPLRQKGVLIIGSGNMVHNLGMVAWDKMDVPGYGYDWAIEANEKMKKFILAEDHRALIRYESQGEAFDLAIPTPEHYLPMLYALALQQEKEGLVFFNDKAIAGSLTMTSLIIGAA